MLLTTSVGKWHPAAMIARGRDDAGHLRVERVKPPAMTDTVAHPKPKDWILGIHAYVPGKAATDDGRPLVKLSANENPLGTGQAAREAFMAAAADMATYPDPAASKLRAAIGAKHGRAAMPGRATKSSMCATALPSTTSPRGASARRLSSRRTRIMRPTSTRCWLR